MQLRKLCFSVCMAGTAWASDSMPNTLEESRQIAIKDHEWQVSVDKPLVYGGNRDWTFEFGYAYRLNSHIQWIGTATANFLSGDKIKFNGESFVPYETMNYYSLGLRTGLIFNLSEDTGNAFYISPTVAVQKFFNNPHRNTDLAWRLEFGKRFQITENLSYRPSLALTSADEHGVYVFQPLGFSWSF